MTSDKVDSAALYHLSKLETLEPQSQPQLYTYGFNAGGRPDGLWFARGDTWRAIRTRDAVTRTTDRYMHRIIVDESRVLRVGSTADCERLDDLYGHYWLNYEYFNLDFTDATTGQHFAYRGRAQLSWPELSKRPGQTLREIMIENGVISLSAEDAARSCPLYRELPADTVERFRFPDWGRVSEQWDGVWFDFDAASPNMRYFWYQSLDAPSGCVWAADAVKVRAPALRA